MPPRESSVRCDRQTRVDWRARPRAVGTSRRARGKPAVRNTGWENGRPALGCHVALKRDRGFLSGLPRWEHRRMPDRHCARAECTE